MQELREQIETLKKAKNALILAHNYQTTDIQDLADFRGDSLQLSILSKEASAEIIVFCGVRFMAETAAILNPSAKVLLPVEDAGCPMADMITAEQLRAFKAKHPGAAVVCYVNSSVEVKAESDVCCTSSNAVKVVSSFPKNREILFVPDQNLGTWAAKQSGRKVITWNGYCPVHHWGLSLRNLREVRAKYPEYKFLAHPECQLDLLQEADLVMSTGGMMDYVSTHDEVILATEKGLIDYLRHIYPEKKIVALSEAAICQNMKKTRMEDLLRSLETETHHIQVEPGIAERAVACLNRMLELSR
ncbi:MAG: quinolinate synthase NadA [Candidatus Cloacimonadota bacterium]